MKKFSVIVLAMLFVFGLATAAFAASYNDEAPYGSTYSATTPYVYSSLELNDTLAADDTVNDNAYKNANGSGEGVGGQAVNTSVIKSQGMVDNNGVTKTQRTHGEYQNNTNSCASCHQTHTGAAKNLLFKSSVYNTCTACHDGTLGFYNVFSGSTAGTFGGNMEGNASIHLATGAQKLSAAPGGNRTGTKAAWTSDFTCASCHAPHGSYSDRLLHYDPNNLGITPTTDDIAGKKKVNVAVYGANGVAIPAVGSAALNATIVIIDTVDNLAGNAALSGFAASPAAAHTPSTDYVAIAVKKATSTATTWTVDATPWLYGYTYGSPKDYYSALKTADTGSYKDIEIQPDSTSYPTTVHYELGLAYANLGDGTGLKVGTTNTPIALTNILFADIAPATVVKLTFDPTPIADFGGIDIVKVDDTQYSATGKGVQMSTFCAACHVDYMGKSSATGFGTYTFANRHTTNSDTYVCLKCHFAHGTDVTVMSDAKDQTVTTLVAGGMVEADAKAYLLDQNASSALKRYTNMAVCWKCHTDSKAGQLKNNNFFWENYDTVPHGF